MKGPTQNIHSLGDWQGKNISNYKRGERYSSTVSLKVGTLHSPPKSSNWKEVSKGQIQEEGQSSERVEIESDNNVSIRGNKNNAVQSQKYFSCLREQKSLKTSTKYIESKCSKVTTWYLV